MSTSPLGDLPVRHRGLDAEPAVRPAAEDPAYRAKAEAAAEKFEGLLIADMLRQMRRTTRALAAEDSIYKDRVNDDMLDLADTLMADALAGQRAFGIADAILRQILPTAPVATAGDLSPSTVRSPSVNDG